MDSVVDVPDEALPVPADLDGSPRYRSGAVARMVRMPVATLRIWERRYRVAAPSSTASGHRLYSAADVQRLALLKQLTDLGHAIGSIAALTMEQLQQVARTHVSTIAAPRVATPAAPAVAWRLAVIGSALCARLQRPGLLRRVGHEVELAGPHETLSQAIQGLQGQSVDALLLHLPGLHAEDLADIQAAAEAIGARRIGVLYGFAAEPVLNAFVAAGIDLLREPQADAGTALWLRE
ncbi:MAG: MerR family transcriptional regulator, partial [Leptothrix sp. (in: b-proteobacteria)]